MICVNTKKGFTLVELIVVIAVLGTLAIIMIPSYADYVRKAKDSNYVTSAKSWCSALQVAIAENKINPGTWDDVDDLSGVLTTLPAIQGVSGTLMGKVEYDTTKAVVIVVGQNCTVSIAN